MLEEARLAYCQLQSDIVAAGLAVVESYSTLNTPSMEERVFIKIVDCLAHHVDVVLGIAERMGVCAPTPLVGGEKAIGEIICRLTADT